MDRDRALAWSRDVGALQRAAGDAGAFAALWMNSGMQAGARDSTTARPCAYETTALACFLVLRRYAHTNKPSDLRLAHELVAAQLARGPLGASPLDAILRMLHSAIWRAYEGSGRIELDYLRRAVDVGRRTLENRALVNDDDRVSFIVERMLALQEWSQQTDTPDTLSQAVLLWRRALTLSRWEDERSIALCQKFAADLDELASDSVDIELVADEVIAYDRRIFAASVSAPAQQLSTSLDLADWLSWRFERTGTLIDLEEEITVRRRILQMYPTQDGTRADYCDGLVDAFATLVLHAPGSMRFLDEYVAVTRESLQLRPQGDPARTVSCSNLAGALNLRLEQTGDHSLLVEIIALERESLLLDAPEGIDRATSCNNLANYLLDLYDDTHDSESLDEAETLLEEAIRLAPADHVIHALACTNLATLCQTRYEDEEDQSYIIRAVELHTKALEIPGQADSQRAEILNDLAYALWEQMRSSDSDEGVESYRQRAIAIRHEVLTMTSSDQPAHIVALLGLVWIEIDNSTAYFDPPKAIEHLKRATAAPSVYNRFLMTELSVLLADPDIPALPAEVMPQLLEVYDLLLSWLALPNYTVNMQDRLRNLESTHCLGSNALACALKAEDVRSGVELLEHSRALLWLHALNIRDSEVEKLPEDKRSEMESVRRSFSLSTADASARETHAYLTPRDLLHRKAERLQELISDVRALPGHERFMRGLSYADLAATASAGPVVVLSAAADDADCHAIVIPSPTTAPIHVPILGLTPNELQELTLDCVDSARNVADHQNEHSDEASLRLMRVSKRSTSSRSYRHLAVLWHKVVAPILQALRLQKVDLVTRPRLTWCPTGEFVFAPVHAAGVYEGPAEEQECCSDYVVSSYTPTLSALRRAQDGPVSRTRSELAVLAVAEGRATNLPFLANAAAEAEQVIHIAQAASVDITAVKAGSPSTTIDNLKTSLSAADIVHLSCHGVQDQEDPLLSGFCFGDGKLTVNELVQLNLPRAWVAFMSACETAKGDHEQPDQTVHLAAAMLFCGFRSVIGTMWSMGDEDGPEVAKTVYEALFEQETVELNMVPRALDAAVRKLRAQGVAPERWATFIHLGA